MIIYGTKNKELAKEIVLEKCQNCGTQNSIDLYVFQNYAHLFWIPVFPMGKTGASQCGHCKQVLKLNEMPASLKASYHNLAAQAKTPIWTFAGLAAIAGLIILGVFSSKMTDKKNAQLIAAPQSGDIFEIKTKDNHYTLFKVSQVLGDSVFIQINNYETNKTSGLDDLLKKGFAEDLFGFSKAELKVMLDKGEIINVDRK